MNAVDLDQNEVHEYMTGALDRRPHSLFFATVWWDPVELDVAAGARWLGYVSPQEALFNAASGPIVLASWRSGDKWDFTLVSCSEASLEEVRETMRRRAR